MIRHAFRVEGGGGGNGGQVEDPLLQSLRALRTIGHACRKLDDSRRLQLFAQESCASEAFSILEVEEGVDTASAAFSKDDRATADIINTPLCEYGLCLLASVGSNSGTASEIHMELKASLDGMAEMVRLIDNQNSGKYDKDTSLLDAMNQVFFNQHGMEICYHYKDYEGNVTLATHGDHQHELLRRRQQQEQQEKVEGRLRQQEDEDSRGSVAAPTSSEALSPVLPKGHSSNGGKQLFQVDSVMATGKGTPLIVASLYCLLLGRLGMQSQVLQVPNSQHCLVVAASRLTVSSQPFLERPKIARYVIDLSSNGYFEYVPISQLRTALGHMHMHSMQGHPCDACQGCANPCNDLTLGAAAMPGTQRKNDILAGNLMRSVDICISLARKLSASLQMESAHREKPLVELRAC
jgi:hypothetical protein